MIRKIILFSLLLVALAACTLNFAAPGNDLPVEPTTDPRVLIAQAVSQTFDAQTHIAQAVQQTLAAMATNTPEFTFTPSLTFTPSFTPTPVFTLTPVVPTVSVSVETNCRTGPGTVYDKLGILPVGKTADVVGRSASSDNWIIKLPSNPAITCWLWGKYATLVGDTSGLPVIIPPPTPTPAASFNVVYTSTGACIFATYAIKFQITNTGSLTWESNRVIALDQVTSETKEYSWDDFPNFNDIGCALDSTDPNLDAGEVGHTSSMAFSANPAGHNFTATIKVCSLDGMAGICLEKTITFTP